MILMKYMQMPDAITQILLNCFDNAQKFSENGLTVILKVRSNESSLELEVQDSGRGILKKDLPKIFNRFYRIEDNEKAREEGSGLGLSIIKEFVDLHGGSVKVTSELNKGTTIHINIPLQMKQENVEVNL